MEMRKGGIRHKVSVIGQCTLNTGGEDEIHKELHCKNSNSLYSITLSFSIFSRYNKGYTVQNP